MKKLASLLFAIVLVCMTFVTAASPAAAAYQAEFDTNGSGGGGPRTNFGTTENATEYMVIGAYGNINNIDTKSRDLKIYSSSSGENPITVQLVGLPPTSSAPSSASLKRLMIDTNTGKLYIKSRKQG